MASRKWTIVLVPHGTGESRSLAVSVTKFRVLASALAVVVVGTLGFTYATANLLQSEMIFFGPFARSLPKS